MMSRMTHSRYVVAVSPPTISGNYRVGVRAVTTSQKAKSRISPLMAGNLYSARVASVLHALRVTDPSRVITLLLEDDLAEHTSHAIYKWEAASWTTSSGHPVACAQKWKAILQDLRCRDVLIGHIRSATPADCRELARLREDLRCKIGASRAWESRRAA